MPAPEPIAAPALAAALDAARRERLLEQNAHAVAAHHAEQAERHAELQAAKAELEAKEKLERVTALETRLRFLRT